MKARSEPPALSKSVVLLPEDRARSSLLVGVLSLCSSDSFADFFFFAGFSRFATCKNRWPVPNSSKAFRQRSR